MDRAQIQKALESLGTVLDAQGVTGEIVLVGGAVMLLVIGSREATRDIDAYFVEGAETIRAAARKVAQLLELPPDWINDAAKGFFYSEPPTTKWAEYPGLRVYVANPDYVLAMKAMAGRPEDVADIQALFKHLGLAGGSDILEVVSLYVPERLIPPRTHLLIESMYPEEA